MTAEPFIAPSGRRFVNPVKIIRDVASRHHLTPEEISSPTYAWRISHPRHEAMWELRRCTKLSLRQIAERLGCADHTSALYGIRAHERRIAEGKA